MLAQEKFNQLLKNLSPILKQYGYVKGGTVFRKRQGDCGLGFRGLRGAFAGGDTGKAFFLGYFRNHRCIDVHQ